MSHAVNGQIAGTSDLISLLTGGDHASFASLLDLGESEPGLNQRADGSHANQGNHPKEKESDKDQPDSLLNSKPGSPASLLEPRVLPNVSVTPWAIPSGDFGSGNSGPAGNSTDQAASLPGIKAAAGTQTTRGTLATPMPAPAAIARAAAATPLSKQHALEQDATAAPAHDLSVDDLIDSKSSPAPSDRAVVANQDATVTHAVAALGDNGMVRAVGESPSVAATVTQPLTVTLDNNPSPVIQQSGMDPRASGVPVVQSHAAPIREINSDSEVSSSVITPATQSADPTTRSVGGQVTPSASPQGGVDAVSASAAGGHAQGNGGDAHRGSADAKEAVIVSASSPNTLQGAPSGALHPGGAAHGQATTVDSTHPGPAREASPDSQPKELLPSRVEDPNNGRLLGSALRGDLRVGVQTEAFGRVTIQTNAQGGQLSAQLSLENAKESATLAAHLPIAEQKIAQQHGLNASVRVIGSSDGGAGTGTMGREQSGSGRRDPERYNNEAVVRHSGIEHGSSSESRGTEPAVSGSRYFVSSRLDVTV